MWCVWVGIKLQFHSIRAGGLLLFLQLEYELAIFIAWLRAKNE